MAVLIKVVPLLYSGAELRHVSLHLTMRMWTGRHKVIPSVCSGIWPRIESADEDLGQSVAKEKTDSAHDHRPTTQQHHIYSRETTPSRVK